MATGSTSSGVEGPIRQVSDSLYEMYKQGGNGIPTVQILLFHGLPSGDLSNAHRLTWKTQNGSWLWEWLAEDFPGARIYAVSYYKFIRTFDMYLVGENLLSDLNSAEIGQFPHRPVILVGHCVGGLVIKKICLQAYSRLHSNNASEKQKKQLGKFLENLRGIFYYGTPHRGSSRVANTRQDGPLFDYFKVLNKDAARLNYEFDDLRGSYRKWQIYALGESLPTNSGCFGDVEVPEASSREGDCYNVVAADHNSICQPNSRIDKRFSHLKTLIVNTMKITAEEAEIQEQKRLQDEASREEARLLEAYPENLQHLSSELTGFEEQAQEIIDKLDNVRMLCLTGMGGSGKTTLAQVVFNELCHKFEFTCFICDIKLITGSKDDVEDAILERLHQGGKRVRGSYSFSKLRGKMGLFVLDDISSRENNVLSHLADVVASESRFIVTCRQESLLKISNTVHKVEFLNEYNSKQLFMKCVFPEKEAPPVELQGLVGAIVKKCAGLPLTLEVLGKYLVNDQSYERWEQTLSALEKVEDVAELNETLWAKLRLSYDGLGRVEQQMFLDACTFFSATREWSLEEAKSAWRAAYKTCSDGLQWKTLVDRSLVYDVQEDDCIEVHEQLRSLGRKIASESSNYREYRVWDGEAGIKMLQNNTNELDLKKIHALRLVSEPRRDLKKEDDEAIRIARTTLHNLKNLRYLEAKVPVSIDGAPDGAPFPTRLVLFSGAGHHFLFDPALQTELTILRLFDLEYLPDAIGHLSCLNHLQIKRCYNLFFAPEFFNKLSSLRLLTLTSCRGFQSLPESVKHLSALRHLKFHVCPSLHSLPESFGQLSSLTNLKFYYCYALHTLPESFGQLSSLTDLKFGCCRTLHTLPESFGQLSSLTHLHFMLCEALHSLPESFGQLSSLTDLKFRCCLTLHTLPESFGQLSSLIHLEFRSCEALHTLPESFGQLSSLSNVSFLFCYALHTLPESFGQLSSLSHLDFSYCDALHTLPESFGQLSSLTNLKFLCKALHTLPESFGQLSSLSHLTFDSCKALHTLPESFGQLSSLTDLKFHSCNALHTLPESFGQLSSLSHLTFDSCKALHTLPESFGQLSSLTDLKFHSCNALHTLPESFGQLSSLGHLEFFGCKVLLTLPESLGQLSALNRLQFHFCRNLGTLPKSFRQLSSLIYLSFRCTEAWHPLPTSFGQLTKLPVSIDGTVRWEA